MKTEHASDSLKYQWRIMGAVLRSDWATSLDKSIAFEIVDNYRKEFRNSRASLGYLVKATGADRKSVIASTRRLVENGPFGVVRQGAGTRPTEYAIDFDSVQDLASSGADTTTNKSASSRGVGSTSRSGVAPTTSGHSSGTGTTESVLPVAAYKAGLHGRDIDPAAPALGLAASAAGAGDGFEKLWKAYGKTSAGNKKSAREAYDKLSPDVADQDTMIEAAIAWRERWEAQGNPDAPRFTLAKWIEREEYECDPPKAYQPKVRNAKAMPAPSPKPANDNRSAKMKPDFTIYPDRSTAGVIEYAKVCEFDDDGAKALEIVYRIDDGATVEQLIMFESPDPAEQARGMTELRALEAATGVPAICDHADRLLARRVGLVVSGVGESVRFVSLHDRQTGASSQG